MRGLAKLCVFEKTTGLSLANPNLSRNKTHLLQKRLIPLSHHSTIKSKCISCFDPHCTLHLCSIEAFNANKVY